MQGDPSALPGLFAALGAGLVSFASPCVLPLVPGYLSAVSGVSVTELDRVSWRDVLAPSLIFVASFSAIFILLALGLYFVASLFIVRLNREWHVEALMARAGKGGPVVAGAAFAIAWTPCIGPTLGAILTAASISSSAAHAALLLAVYSAGLGIPFLITALAFSRMTTAFSVIKRHYAMIMAAGGAILIAMGVLILTGGFTDLNIQAQKWTSDLGLNP